MKVLLRYCKPLLFLLSLAIGQMALAQEVPTEWRDYIDRWQEESGDESSVNTEELETLYQSLIDNPVNLNDTLSDALRQIPFVGDLRWRILKAYIAQHGPLLSIDELYLLNGYSRQLVDMLHPIVTVTALAPSDTIGLRTLLTQGRHQLLVGGSTAIERARGYREGQYEGDPWRMYMRYQYHYRDRLQLSLSADKDAGEAFFYASQRQGFDFYSGHLSVRDIGIVRQAIIGHYNLQFGQGLTLWTGFAPYGSFATDGCRYARGVATASAFAEQGYLQGGATTLRLLPQTELTLFYSNVARDATRDTSGTITSISASGYHRTTTEIAKKDNLREQLYGLHLQYASTGMQIGLTLCRTHLSESIVPRDYVYNHYAFTGDGNFNIGIDGRYRYRSLTLYGEASVSLSGGIAALAGASIALTPDHRFDISARHYSTDYYNLHVAPPERTSGGRNEQGLCLAYQVMLPCQIKAVFEADVYRLPAMHSGIYAPSQGSLFHIGLSRQFTHQTQIAIGYNCRRREKNSTLDSVAEYVIEQTERHQLTADIHCEIGQWHLRTRIANCWYNTESTAMQRGFMVFQDLQYTATRLPMSITMRFLLFDADSYDARLYAAESDLAYQMGSTSFYGKGYRFYAVARYAITQSLCLSAKYGITTYPDVTHIGTSYEQTDGDHRQTLKLQIRWSF